MKRYCLILLIAIILSACSTPEASNNSEPSSEKPTTIVETPIIPTQTQISPTITLAPTATQEPTLTPTILPEGVLFRDDFNKELQPGWVWENENKAKWTITDDGWLQIIAEDPSLFFGGYQSNLLLRDLPEGDFEVIIHAIADPTEPNQSLNLMLYQDQDNNMEISRAFCGPCEKPGSGFYMDYKISGSWGFYQTLTNDTDVYMMIRNQNNVISGYYAVEPENWISLGKLGNYYEFKQVGIGVTNSDGENLVNSDLVSKIDFIEIRVPK